MIRAKKLTVDSDEQTKDNEQQAPAKYQEDTRTQNVVKLVVIMLLMYVIIFT